MYADNEIGSVLPASEVSAVCQERGKRRQGILIAYDLVGFIPLEKLAKEETA